MYEPLYEQFMNHVTNSQHGFIKGGSVLINMLRYLNYVREALDKDSKIAARAFYTDFAKIFDKRPHHVLLKKLENLGVVASWEYCKTT